MSRRDAIHLCGGLEAERETRETKSWEARLVGGFHFLLGGTPIAELAQSFQPRGQRGRVTQGASLLRDLASEQS